MEAKQSIFVSMPVLFLSMMVAPLGCLIGLFVTRVAITTE
jgi:hypothetical protein